jgi:hypothetical protein
MLKNIHVRVLQQVLLFIFDECTEQGARGFVL